MRIKLKSATSWITILFNTIITGGLMLSITNAAYASTNIIVYDEKSAYQKEFYQHLKNKTNASSITLIALDSSGLDKQRIQEYAPSLIINLDKNLPQKLVNLKLKAPVLHTLITRANSNSFLTCQLSCEIKNRQHHFFVLDQPPERQLALIKLIKPNAKNIGVIYSEQTVNQITVLETIANRFQFKIKRFETSPDNLGFKINNMNKSSDVLLALADTVIYNSTTLPQILLTSYRYHTPVIGFSKSFITAGAVAGVVSNLNQLATQVAEVLLDSEGHQPIMSNGIIYPKYFDVISNRRVANSLNLHFPSDNALTSTLKSREIP